MDFNVKAQAYANTLSKLGFEVDTALSPQGGRLETPKLVDAAAEINKTELSDLGGFIEFDTDNEGTNNIRLKIADYTIEDPYTNSGKIKISIELYNLLGIPGDYEEVKDGVDIHIFNEYRLPILHHILNLRIFLANESGNNDNKLSKFFVEDDNLSNICKTSLKTGRFLNATGYHIKEDQKLTRFDVDSFEINGNTIANKPPATMDQFLNLFQPIGKTSRDRKDVERAKAVAQLNPGGP